MNRTRVINSICKMFNEVHNNSSTPEWMLELQNSASDEMLVARMDNWMRNYPEEFAQHGIYIL